ncbi:MAG: hypothetical protein IJJ57_07900 [Ruminococcus sp.]|nr:hypothetical protein [Ruminococcus sp.]
MKRIRLTAALCALAVVVSSAGGLPFGGLRLFDTAVTASAEEFEGDGSESNPYLIKSADDWNTLASSSMISSGSYFMLTSDISVTTAIGVNTPFTGVFDGDGHTLTVDLNSSSSIAPFANTKVATIKNLKVEGSVKGGIHSAGLVKSPQDSSDLNIENVTVNVNVSGSTHLGGIIGHSLNAKVTLDNCIYGGNISATQFSGGLIGWCGYTNATISNCVFCGSFSGTNRNPIGFSYNSQGSATLTNVHVTTDTFSTQHVFKYTGSRQVISELSVTAPTAKADLAYSGAELEILNAGATNKGTMQYSLDGKTYSEDIPPVNSSGTYKVWYRVVLDGVAVYEYSISDIIVTHGHTFSYTASGSTITASCTDDCDITAGLTMTISAPTDLKANGSPKEATLSTGYNTTAFPGTYTIEYYKGEEKLDGAPSAGGHYTAKVTVGSATASVDFTIVVAPTYTITIPESVNLKSSDPVSIEAEGVELNEGEKIVVTLDSATYTESGSEFSAKDKSGESVVSYSIKAGDTDVSVGGTVAEFVSSADTQSVSLNFTADASNVKYAGAHTETLTFGVKLEEPNAPKIYNKNSENIADGVVLENVGDTIDTTDTLKGLIFNTSAKMDFKIDGNDETMVINFQPNAQINGVESMYLDDNRDFICVTSTGKGKLIPDEGKQFRVKYNLEDNRWIIDQV